VPRGAFDRMLQARLREQAVGQISERIVMGQMLEAILRFLDLAMSVNTPT